MRSRRNRQARRGSALYVTVLSTALIVSLLGLTGLTIVRIERKQMSVSSSRDAARTNANSAVELALRVIANDPNWRTTYANGVETTPQSLHADATGTLSWIVEDTDGSLTDADTNLRLKGVGRVGNTMQVSSVRLVTTANGMDSLLCPFYAKASMTANDCTVSGGPVSTAGTHYVEGDIIGDGEGTPIVYVPHPTTGIPGSISGTATDPAPDRGLPDPNAWDTYTPLATSISFNSFPLHPLNPNEREGTEALLSHLHNPWGFTDSDGVYHIQIPAGWTLSLDDIRISATLLIELGEGATFKTGSKVLWDPSTVGNYPTLIAKAAGSGTVHIKGGGRVKEKSINVNLNPVELPYLGSSDSQTNDQYDQKLTGLIHLIGASGLLRIKNGCDFTGVAITDGTGDIGSNAILTRDPNIFNSPPVGYVPLASEPTAVSGSWIWDAAL